MPSPPVMQNPRASGATTGAAGQFRAMLSGCGIARLSWRVKLGISGSDAVRWLNGMTTNNVRDLPPGHGVYGFVLNPQGQIQGDGCVFHRGESLIFDTGSAQVENLKAIFDHFIIMDDVEVSDLPVGAIGVTGPRSQTMLSAVGINASDLRPLQFAELDWRGLRITLVRTDQPEIPAYEVWGEASQLELLWQALMDAGAQDVDQNAMELLRIASGMPVYAQDIRARDLPQETEQARALNFNKGCYIGQEIVERIRSRGNVHRKFTGFEVEGPLPPVGTKIQLESKDVGEITSTAVLPLREGEMSVALGYIRREHSGPGKRVQAAEATLTVADVPFRKVFEE